jgi:hypothetical protein
MAEQITFKYYTGVLAFYNEQFDLALPDLQFAFDQLPEDDYQHQILVLFYLIPIQLLNGRYPSRQLLERYPIMTDIFIPLVDAIYTGNLVLFDSTLEQHTKILLQKGAYMSIESCRGLVIRSLFRQVYEILGTTRIAFSSFQKALALSTGKEVDMDQVECWLVNAIDKGYMKGYLSHEKLTAVLSNKDPFP